MTHGSHALGAALQLAAERHAAAEKLLGQAHARVNDAGKTLDTLTRYRNDYADRWRTSSMTRSPRSAMNVKNAHRPCMPPSTSGTKHAGGSAPWNC
jgi:flagellar biosynthesis chaperone FliJ